MYFGREAQSCPIFIPISSNGFAAAPTTLLTHLAAMNAIQIKRSAMISTTIVQNTHPVELMILVALLTAQAAQASERSGRSEAPVGFHLKTKVTPPMTTSLIVIYFPFESGPSSFLFIIF